MRNQKRKQESLKTTGKGQRKQKRKQNAPGEPEYDDYGSDKSDSPTENDTELTRRTSINYVNDHDNTCTSETENIEPVPLFLWSQPQRSPINRVETRST